MLLFCILINLSFALKRKYGDIKDARGSKIEDYYQNPRLGLSGNGTCNEKIELQYFDSKGLIISPNYENGAYPNNSDCEWEISIDPGMIIKFQVMAIDLEPGPPSCPFDYIELFVKPPTGPKAGQWVPWKGPDQAQTRYCGTYFPKGLQAISQKGSHLKIHFVSDESENRRGFMIRFGAFRAEQLSYIDREDQKDDFAMVMRTERTKKLSGKLDLGLPRWFDRSWPNGSQQARAIQFGRPESIGSFEYVAGDSYDPYLPRNDSEGFSDGGYLRLASNQMQTAILATKYIRVDSMQAEPYCFEMKMARSNPKNLTREDFGEVKIYTSFFRFDRNQKRFGGNSLKEVVTIPVNETFDADGVWKPVQAEVNHREGEWVQIFVVAERGTQDSTDVLLDEFNFYNSRCQPMDFATCDGSELVTPKWGRLQTGKWLCRNGYNLGSQCRLFCRPGFMPEPQRFYENTCERGGWKEPTDPLQCIPEYCIYPTKYRSSDTAAVNVTESEGVESFECTRTFMPSDNADLATIGRGEICDLQCLPGYRSKLPNQSSEIFCSGASPGDGSPLFWLAGVLRTNETIHFRQSIPRAEDLYLNDVVRPNMVGCEKITVELIEDIEEYEEELDKSIDKIVEEAEDAKEVKEDVLVAFVVEDKRFTTRTTTTTTTASTSSVYQGPKIVVQPSPTSSTTTTTTSDGLTKTTTPKTTTTEENPFAQWEKQVTEADLDGMLQTPNPNEEYETTPEPEPEPDNENEDKKKNKNKKKDSPSSAVNLLASFLAIFLIFV